MADLRDRVNTNLSKLRAPQEARGPAYAPSPVSLPDTGVRSQIGGAIDKTPVLGGVKEASGAGLGALAGIISKPSELVENILTGGKTYEEAGYGLLSTPARMVLDPLNIFTFGGATVAKLALKEGAKGLAKEVGKAGAQKLTQAASKAGEINLTRTAGKDLATLEKQVGREAAEAQYRKRIADGDSSVIDQGGLKLDLRVPFTDKGIEKTLISGKAFSKAAETAGLAKAGSLISKSPLGEWVGDKFIYAKGVSPEVQRAVDKGQAEALKFSKFADTLSAQYVKTFKAAEAGDSLAQAELKAVQDAIRGVEGVKSEMGEAVRKTIDELGKRAVDLGFIDEAVYLKGSGSYLPRLYQMFEQDTELAKLVGSKNKIGKQELSRTMKREDLSKARRKELGEITDPGYLAAKGLQQVGALVAKGEMLRNIKNLAGRDPVKVTRGGKLKELTPKGLSQELLKTVANAPVEKSRVGLGDPKELQSVKEVITNALLAATSKKPAVVQKAVAKVADALKDAETLSYSSEGLVKLTESKAYGALSDVYVPTAVKKFLDGIDKTGVGNSSGMKVLAFLTGRFKAYKTIYDPGQQVRNVFSNQILMFMQDPQSFKQAKEAWKVVLDKGPEFEEMRKVGLFNADFAGQEIDEVLKAITNTTEPGGLADIAMKYSGVGSRFEQKSGDLRQLMEEVSKAQVYLRARKMGASAETAKDLAEETLFAYQKVTPFVKMLRNYPIPFLTFAIKAAPFVAKQGAKHPGRLVIFPKLEQAVERMSEGDAPNEEFMPDWMRGMVRLPFKDAQGDYTYFNPKYIYPWGGINSEETGTPFGLDRFPLGLNLSPFITETAQQLTNQDFYFDKDIVKPADEATGDALGKRVQHAAKAFLPGLTPGFGKSAQNLSAAVKGEEDYGGRKRSVLQTVIGEAGGLKTYSYREKDERVRSASTEKKSVKELNSAIYSLKQNKGIAREERDRKIKALMDKIREIQSN